MKKENTKKNKEEAAENAKVWAKRLRKAKKNTRNRFSIDTSCSH